MSHKQKKKLRKLARHLIETKDMQVTQESRYRKEGKKISPSKKTLRKLAAQNGISFSDIEHIHLPEGYTVDSDTIRLAGCEKALVKLLEREKVKFETQG